MRADRVEISWDATKKSWLVLIINGGEVIRRYSKLPKESDEPALRSMAHQALIDEGFDSHLDEGFDSHLTDGPAVANRDNGKISWKV